MTTFPSIAAFTAHLARVAAVLPTAQRQGEDEAGHALADAARAMIGTEDAAWPALAEATVAEKRRLGFTGKVSATDPLLRHGELRDSIGFQVTARGLLLGSTSKVAPFQEFGTGRIPPRPFIGPTLFRHGHAAVHHIAGHMLAVLASTRAPPVPKF